MAWNLSFNNIVVVVVVFPFPLILLLLSGKGRPSDILGSGGPAVCPIQKETLGRSGGGGTIILSSSLAIEGGGGAAGVAGLWLPSCCSGRGVVGNFIARVVDFGDSGAAVWPGHHV